MNILKIEAFAGASGDMFLGALCALADAFEEITALPALLNLEEEAEIRIEEVNKTGIACRHVKVIDKKRQKPGEQHRHRHLKDIYRLLGQGRLPTQTQAVAMEIFRLLGEAEAQVHGVPLEKIHFHEVGAIDSIIDIAGTAWLLEKLGIDKAYSTPVITGFGFVMTEHGRLPVPAPATQRLLLGMPTERGDQQGELITPTGAAILRYLKPEFDIPVLTEMKIGYGPGEKDLEIPNALRLSLCQRTRAADTVTVIQVNLDDMPGEGLGHHLQQQLLSRGALDLYLQQVIMKKGRPGIVLTLLGREEKREELCRFLLQNTSGIGLRYHSADRMELERAEHFLDLPQGRVRIKEVILPDGTRRIKAESEDLFRLSSESGAPWQELEREVQRLWSSKR